MYYVQPVFRNNPHDPLGKRRKKEIHVTGEGTVSVQPDRAEITLGVSTEDIELKKAQEENGAAIAKVIQSLREMGINEDNIQTVEYSIYPLYDFSNGQQVFRGYRVNHMVSIAVADIDRVGSVVDAAVTSGANNVRNITFSLSNSAVAYQKALSLAVESAIAKANTIAQSLQVQLIPTPVQVVEVLGGQKEPIPFGETQMVKSAAATQIEPGTQAIKALVRAIFLYYF
jgi:uncharacterized protein YggE